MTVIRTLYVDDEPALLDIVRDFLELTGDFEVITFSSVADALLALSTEKFDVILSDYQMPGMDGIEFLKKVKESHNGIPFVLFTGRGREEVAIEAINNGADFYIRKGGDTKAQFAELINAISQAVARKEAEEALTYNLCHFRTLIENATDIIAETDRNGKIRYVSPSIKRTLGYDPDEMIGKLITDFVHPEDSSKVIERTAAILVNGQGPPFELRMSTMDHDWKILEVSGTRSNSKNPTIVINAHDVTERNHLVEGLRNMNRMRDFLSGINQAILGSDEGGELFQKCCQIAVEKGLFKMAWIGLILPEGRVMPVASYGEAGDYLRNILITVDEEPSGCGPCGTSIKSNSIIVCNDIANDPTAIPWRDQATRNGFDSMIMMPIRLYGRPVGAFGLYSEASNVFTKDEIGLLQEIEEDISLAVTSYDISVKRKAAEDELKDSEEKYRSLFDNMREGFAYCEMIYDRERKPIDWIYHKVNPAFYRLTGLKDIVGKSVKELIPGIEEMNPELFEIYGDVAKTGLPREFEIEFKPLKLSLKVSAFSPKLDHFVAIFEDFTEYIRKMTEQRLANKKFELLGQISRHDIMNQLLLIDGISDVLRKNSENEQLARSLDSIQNASEKIERILQFGKEYEEIGIRNPEWIDIFRTISRTSINFTQVKIEIDISLEGLRVYADPMIERVFFNLFDNAIRHGGKTAQIKVGRHDTPEEMVIAVEDDGVGISVEEKARLFQYGQGEGKRFGLYLCKEILEMTGLKLKETGIPGKGARFEVHIPKENVLVERNIVHRSSLDR